MQKPCTCCGETKPLGAYRFNERTGRYALRCVDCGDGEVKRTRRYAHKTIKNLLRKKLSTANLKRRGYEVTVTLEDLLELYEQQGGKCAISGVELTSAYETAESNVSIDRIDCNKGYELGNVRLICSVINMMRCRLQDEELLYWCKAVVEGMTGAD